MKPKDIIIFPTDTVYGMGAKLYDKKGLNCIYQIKKRPLNKSIVVLCASLQQAKKLVQFSPQSLKLALHFWPGPLTLILPTTLKYFSKTKAKTLGVRIPNHPLALEILKKNGPLKTTSVNQSNHPPLNDYQTIFNIYHNKVALIYQNYHPILKISSTIVDLTTFQSVILRQGTITQEEILQILKPL
ncbi:threonylcarbamoyl-AMP synthase ['Elaeagnus angustifolia' witches'-broom phytoplasma]|uniref:L-threonylcarbamoyladenylate synthase n=1 Tax='Elaeagnus angustifolia' witches'-broom phytoplasma TaxID=1538355 RepID=A0ABS5VA98_9MOLU|nr:threonylcarbamoyl-AMP synthase ['Elaeagnus angustifolia' witches'-broom phytoplasma]MCX2955629.1 L-threonylcarbamoyladenylate synthase [Candidatus Phytoplasma australiense]